MAPSPIRSAPRSPTAFLSNNDKRIQESLLASPTPRSWEFVDNILTGPLGSLGKPRLLNIAVAGKVGEEAANHLAETLKDMTACKDPNWLLDISLKEAGANLPSTLRGSLVLAYSLCHVANTPPRIIKSAAIMKRLGETLNDPSLNDKEKAAINNPTHISGNEISALGIERLMRKAEEKGWTDEILSSNAPGADDVRNYLIDLDRRQRQFDTDLAA